MRYQETKFGFCWGAVEVSRGFSDKQKGWVTLLLDTPKHKGHESIQVYCTKTGKIRIFSKGGEWTPPKKAKT